jgi:hypothetical protein
VKFCINGRFESVFVDDNIPIDKNTGALAFSRTKDGSFWLSILEKAWAKIHGNYERTVNGTIGDAYLIMTGAPVHVINLDIEEESLRMSPDEAADDIIEVDDEEEEESKTGELKKVGSSDSLAALQNLIFSELK